MSSDDRQVLKSVTVYQVDDDGQAVAVADDAPSSDQGSLPSDSSPEPMVSNNGDDSWMTRSLGRAPTGATSGWNG